MTNPRICRRALLLAMALLIAACTSEGPKPAVVRTGAEAEEKARGATNPALATTETDAAASPQRSPHSDGDASSRPPRLELVGQDYTRMVRSHYAYRDWLFEHPDPARVGELMHPDCTCFEDDRILLEDYQARGLRWRGGHLEVLSIDIIDDQAENMLHLGVVVRRAEPGELVDAAGTVHDRLEPIGPHAWEEIYRRETPTKPWRLRVADELGPVTSSSREGDA